MNYIIIINKDNYSHGPLNFPVTYATIKSDKDLATGNGKRVSKKDLDVDAITSIEELKLKLK